MLTHLQPTPIVPARVVVLGATGFIPRALAANLTAMKVPFLAVGSRQVDLTAPQAGPALAALLQPNDALVMAAALTPDKGRDVATLMKNLRMAEGVANALAVRSVAHLVYLSSDAVYDWRHPLISEATAPSPTDIYATMHLTRERMLAAAASAAQVPYCVLRPCAVYGPGDTHNSYGPNRFARTALAEGRIQLFGSGDDTRDHVFIDDVTTVIALVVTHCSTGVLNVVTGRSSTFAEVAARIAALSATAVDVEHLTRAGPATHRHFDTSALLRSFPSLIPIPMDHGLRRLMTESIGRK